MTDEINRPLLTHASGAPVTDNINIQTAGPRGPALLQDVWLIEKLAHFDREVIPERRMHAKGSGAHGIFTVTHDITRYTRAKIFSEIGKQTPMFARFSTVAGERGAADAERDIRGFALKFYTEEGNWDVVGNNTPVFFFRDPLRFPDLNHAIKRDPYTGMRSADNNWDFWTLLPEALHQVTIVMSERGIPRSYRHMHGFGSHTYSLLNANNERVWVKFHFRTRQGIQNLTDAEAVALVGRDRESHQRDLFGSIERGAFPRWTLHIQVMTDEQATKSPFNPFDLTKVWPKAQHPLIEVGHFELNRNPENVFAEVEQAAFSPANIVPGIGYSPDKMLQARLFSYGDAQRYRLGVNHHHIPVNAPKCPFHSYHRDGAMRTDGNLGRTPTYWPNSRGEWTDRPQLNEPPLVISGAAAHWDHRVDDDHWQQPGNLFRKMTSAQKQTLFDNTARQVGQAARHIQERHVANCSKADPAYGKGVSEALALFAAGEL
ncbi:catalase [Bradyrhizobium jicamae]|uniref:catalase n=1 Tax=Bradyrhizobium jicamae TaxID=280332 RepID=UPI001BA69DA8|nr:catalase [Bradyrhizobium jicamae]MBR0933096.1 catalase [Bradyrhizobium jicamae]